MIQLTLLGMLWHSIKMIVTWTSLLRILWRGLRWCTWFHAFTFFHIHGLWRGWNDSHLTRAKVEFDPFCTAWFPFFHFKCTTSWSDLIILGVFIYSSMAPSYGIKHINCIGRTRFFKWRKVWLHSCRNKDQSMFRLLENSF